MNKLTIKACPLCGGTHLERALTCVDHYASGEMFHLCRCRDCGFLFTQDFPVEAEIGRYYETPDYISHTDTRKGAMNSVYHWVRNYMLGRKAVLWSVKHTARRAACWIWVRGLVTLPMPCSVAAGRWKLWKECAGACLCQRTLQSGCETPYGIERFCTGQFRRHHPMACHGTSGTPQRNVGNLALPAD